MRQSVRQPNGFKRNFTRDEYMQARRGVMRTMRVNLHRQSRIRMNNARRANQQWIKRYRPNDYAKRHRLQDEQPKTQNVRGYTRRT